VKRVDILHSVKRQVIIWVAILVASMGLAILTTVSSDANQDYVKLDIESFDTPESHVIASNGDRGAAIARLEDGRFLLGGGKSGFNLYIYDLADSSETLLGKVAPAKERFDDSRFAITDIGVLSQSGDRATVVISYPRYDSGRDCVSVVLASYQVNFGEKPSVKRWRTWFASKPCVPVGAIQHAAGRIEVIDKSTVYMTVGDLGFEKIDQVKVRGDLGSLFKITSSRVEKISQGHRNQQGIALVGSDLYTSEHGPRGGDELNLIVKGRNYGWPQVTYGEPYSSGDYVKPEVTGSHEGFAKPMRFWVPSVAPTELIQLPAGPAWGKWASQLVMGTLREESLIFIELRDRKTVGQVVKVSVGERIRDLELSLEGAIVATTDSGKLLVIS
jgi:glucose/arabinose dehydrogenase